VMLELGQPTHAYDAAHVAGRALRARRARPGETLETLDGVERQLATAGRGLGTPVRTASSSTETITSSVSRASWWCGQ